MLRRFVGGICLLALMLVCPGMARGAGTELITAVSVKEEYNDNILFATDGEVDDFITTISPEITLLQRTERLSANLSARIDGVIYAENDDLDGIDQRYEGRLGYQITPRFKTDFSARYIMDSRADRDIEESGLVLGTDTRRRQAYSISGTYALTEITSTSVSYAYEQDKFDESRQNDYKLHTASVGLSRHLGALFKSTQGRTNFSYTNIDYTTATVENYVWTIGIQRELSEVYSLLINIGPRYTRTEFDDSTTPANEVWGATGQAMLTYKGEYARITVNLSHDVKPASGRSGSTEQSAFTFNLAYNFTDKFSGSVFAGYYLNKSEQSEFSASSIDENTIRIKPRLRYDFTETLATEVLYGYSLIQDEKVDTERTQNVFFLRFLFQYPLTGS